MKSVSFTKSYRILLTLESILLVVVSFCLLNKALIVDFVALLTFNVLRGIFIPCLFFRWARVNIRLEYCFWQCLQ